MTTLRSAGRQAGPQAGAARNGRPAACLAGAGILWGSSFLFGKWALASVGPVELTLWRFVIASAVLLGVAGRGARPRRRDLPLFAVTGMLYVPATFLPQFAGLERTSASIAALIIGTLPPLVALAARLLLGERLGRAGWAAVAASTAGVALIVGHGGRGNSWTGDALVLSSMAAVVGWVLLGKRLLRDYPPLAATAWITAFGTAALIPISLIWQGAPRLDLPWTAWGSIAALGVGCSAVSTALWNRGLRRMAAGRAGLFLNVEPLTGAILGIAVLGEPLNAAIAIGGALIIGAAAAATRHRTPSRAADSRSRLPRTGQPEPRSNSG
jgi:drug/metabolite transporter (DMT)-like permease